MAVPEGGDRDAGLHRLGLTLAHRGRLVLQGVAVGLVVLLFGLLLWKLVSSSGGDLAAAANRGDQPRAPSFTLPRLDTDGKVALASLQGKAVVLNFWASWCIPCKDEAPYLEQVWRSHRSDGLVVLGLDAKDFRGDARNFARRYGITFPLAYDGPGKTLPSYGVTGFPETYVLNREGRVVQAFVGAINSDEDHAQLQSAVARALSS